MVRLLRGLTAASLTALALVAVPLARSGADAAISSSTTCGADGTPAVIALQDRHFYVDSASTVQLLSGYAGYRVLAGTSARSHLWLKFGGFDGGVLDLAPNQTDSIALPDLASGAAATEYALLTATGPTATPQTHTVTLYDGPPDSGTVVCSRAYTYSDVVDTIKALANKVTSVTASATPTTAKIGDAVTVTVVGNTGTLGAGPANDPGVLDYTPNALAAFPAGAWRLERTELTIAPDGVASPVTYVDRLYLSGASGPARDYTAKYTFRAVGPTGSPADLKPIQYIASGTQVKHTDQGGTTLYSLPPVSPISDISVRKAVTSPSSGVLPSGGGVASYRVTISNAAGHATDLDWLADTLPDGAQFVAGTMKINDRAAADPAIGAGQFRIAGPVRVPASGETTISYSLELDGTPGRRVNSIVAHYADVTFDETPDVTETDPAAATVTVPSDAALNLGDDTATTPANTPTVADVLHNDTAPSGLPLHVTDVGAASSGTAVLSPDGTVTYTPAANTSGTATFTYTATDGYVTGQATVTVTIAPVAARDRYSTGKNTTLTAASVLANDACTSCTVSTTPVTLPGSGTLALNADGTFTYTPVRNASGTVTFTYRATDPATHLTSDGNVSISVMDLAPDYWTTPNATPVSVPVLDNDAGCRTSCTLQTGTNPARGTATYSATADYVPTGALWGLDSFAYGTTGSSGSATTPVTILVGPPAVAVSTTYGAVVIVPLPANGSCTTCVYALATPAAHGAVGVNASTGASSYQPAAGFAGTDSFTYLVKDTVTGLRITGTVNVTVGPKAADDSASVLLGETVSGDAASNDSCSGTCTYTKLTDAASGAVTWHADGTWSYQPGAAIGTMSFTYQVTSALSGDISDTATVRIAVGGAADDTASTAANTAASIDVRHNDPCTECTLTDVSQPTSGTATISGDAVLYTPAADFTGDATFTYAVTQGDAHTTATVTVTVRPEANDDTGTTVLGTPLELLLLANDTCSGCALTSVDEPTSGEVSRTGDVVTFTPSALGLASFTYHAADGAGHPVSATVTITVVAPAALADDEATTPGDTPTTVDVLANDTCTHCTVSITDDPQHGTAVVDISGQVRYFAAPGFSGTDELTYAATDPTGAWAEARVRIVVTPVARDDHAATRVGTAISVDVLANDDCTGCNLTVDSATGDAAATEDTGHVLVTPTAGWTGAVTVTYTATDPSTGSDSAVLTVDVSDARPDSATAPYGSGVTSLDVLANDFCDDCTVTSVTPPDAGEATHGDRTVDWTPSDGFAGLATFGYTAEGTDGQRVSSTVRILVTPAEQHVPAVSGEPEPITVVPADDCVGCIATLVDPPTDGDLDSDGAGGFTYTAPLGWSGDDSFTYRLTDPISGEHVTSTVTITVDQPGTPQAAFTVTPTDVPDAGAAPAASQHLTWTWTLRNTADVTLTAFDLTNSAEGSCATAAPASLAVDATATCTTTHALTQHEIDTGSVTVAAPFTAQSEVGPADGTAESTVPLAHAASITVSAAAQLGSDQPVVGDDVRLTYTVRDDGNTTVTGLTVVLADDTVLDCTATTLTPGGQADCTATHTVTQDDLDAGHYDSAGTATASSPDGSHDLTAAGQTNTTLPEASTPTPTPTGTVTGLVWFDRNGDGEPGAGEWPLPAVSVRLLPIAESSAHAGAVTAAFAAVRTATSDSAGHYRFDHVSPGQYRVVASISLAGFGYTSDTDGGTDWSVLVSVTGGRTSAARFAGLGRGTLAGTVYVEGDGAGVPHADVRCVWAGYDDTLGTADDVVIHTVADAHGDFVVGHVPYGVFSCTGLDPVTSKQSGAVTVRVFSARGAHASLPVSGGQPSASRHRSVSSTGTPTLQLLRLALALLLAGGAAAAAGRRRQQR